MVELPPFFIEFYGDNMKWIKDIIGFFKTPPPKEEPYSHRRENIRRKIIIPPPTPVRESAEVIDINAPKAICVKCRHVHRKKHDLIWYNFYCKMHKKVPITDPITGEYGFKGTNDLGGSYTTDDQYDYCRDHNSDGNCADFKK